MFAPNEEISSNERGEEKKKPGENVLQLPKFAKSFEY